MKNLYSFICLTLCFFLTACGVKTVPTISEEEQKIDYNISLEHIIHQPLLSFGKSQYVINEIAEKSPGKCGVPLKEDER